MKEQEIKPKPVRVLHVLGTTNLGGAESRIMELYRCIDRSQVQFDFLIHTKEDGHYSEETVLLEVISIVCQDSNSSI